MEKQTYTTYSFGEDLTLIEVDRKSIKGKDYVLLLQKQAPNLICAGFFEDGTLHFANNDLVRNEIFKIFTKDTTQYFKKIIPFLNLKTTDVG